MTKPNDEDDKGVELLLTGRRDYLDRLIADLEAGKLRVSDYQDVNTDRKLEYSPSGRVWIPEAVYDGLEMIRQSGVINMADWQGLIGLADALELHEVVTWLAANPVGWMTAVMKGMEAKPEEVDE